MSSLTTSNEPGSPLWRSLDEFEGNPAFIEMLTREFPQGASVWNDLETSVSRRHFIQIMSASMALAGITACTKMPAERIIPYVIAPEEIIPGIPAFFATAGYFGGFSKGLLVESHEGRPTKIEGNPRHPISGGKSDIFMQAELLQLYDPDRLQAVSHLGQITTWSEFNATILAESAKWRANQGSGVRILTRSVTSPTLLNDIQEFLKTYPQAHWHSHEPVGDRLTREATRDVFGQDLRPIYDFTKAHVVVSFDHDFLGPGPAQERYARDFMRARDALSRPEEATQGFNRLYMIESSISITGAAADNRRPGRPTEIQQWIEALAFLLEVPGASKREAPQWLKAVADDLRSNGGNTLVLAGEHLPTEIQKIAFAINQSLAGLGNTVRFVQSTQDAPASGAGPGPETIEELIQALDTDHVSALLILGGNPIYDTPVTLGFAEKIKKSPLRIRLGFYDDETSALSHWVLPESHFLESWGDGRSIDGTVALQQPLISPLYESKSITEFFSILNGHAGRTSRQATRDYWASHGYTADPQFEGALRDGYIQNSAFASMNVKVRSDWKTSSTPAAPTAALDSIEAVIRPDPTLWDGKYSNNAWLQELPKPLLQLTWGNCVLLSPATAKKLELEDEDSVELNIEGRTQTAAVLRAPGHPDGSATLYLGYGRSKSGRVGNTHGYDAYALQNHQRPWIVPSLKIKKLGGKLELATTHAHSNMEGRDLVVHSTLKSYQANPDGIVKKALKIVQPTLLPPYQSGTKDSKIEAWAMVINLTTCIGCNACSIACQAENNIPTVGKDQVRRSREMHWIRVDRYFQGNPSNPEVYFQPVPCMHCEKAPCEEVCPTAATNHSADGLNQMIYNRCVGTRYCSNNCPYKVRRFNFFQYADMKSSTAQMMHNPDVTVRSRGVMEKCSYCIQRIHSSRIEAEKQNRPVRDGEILTACQQACPTDAIIFGDQNNPESRVSKLKVRPHHYALLNDLGTKPRTTYLASIRNPNPKINEVGEP